MICPPVAPSSPPRRRARSDGADGGDEQQEGRDLERQQELRQQQLADLAGLAEQHMYSNQARSNGVLLRTAAGQDDDVPSIADLTAQGADVIATAEPRVFLDDMFYRQRRDSAVVTSFERGLPGQVCKADDWQLGAGRIADG